MVAWFSTYCCSKKPFIFSYILLHLPSLIVMMQWFMFVKHNNNNGPPVVRTSAAVTLNYHQKALRLAVQHLEQQSTRCGKFPTTICSNFNNLWLRSNSKPGH